MTKEAPQVWLGKYANSDQMIEECAIAAHMANRAYCNAIGDSSQPLWEEAPEWQKDSARNGARAALQPDHGPGASHAGWLRQKEEEGWVYGPEKIPEKKEHPCMVPFEELPLEQQAKDYIFLAVVRATARRWENK